MTLATLPALMTIDEFAARPDDDTSGYELIDGVLTESKPMGSLAARVATEITIQLGVFVHARQAGAILNSDPIYRCFGSDRTGRKPDVSFIRAERLAPGTLEGSYIPIPADLAVEVVSSIDLAYDVEGKAEIYLNNGFGELWVVFPNTHTIQCRRRGEPIIRLGVGDTIRGRDALSGFECPVSELFPDLP